MQTLTVMKLSLCLLYLCISHSQSLSSFETCNCESWDEVCWDDCLSGQFAESKSFPCAQIRSCQEHRENPKCKDVPTTIPWRCGDRRSEFPCGFIRACQKHQQHPDCKDVPTTCRSTSTTPFPDWPPTTSPSPDTTTPRIDCQWSGWSKSGECTKSCGGGTQYYQRTISVQSKNGGQYCTGNPIKQEKCNDFDCPVDCRWNNWSDWTSCSKTCGQGSKNRRREVQTRARNGGSLCQGLSRQTQSCNVRDCPVNCQWSSWSETGLCSKSCGGGVQYFERVINVESQNGGQSCTGSRTKREYCNTQNCPCYCNIDNRCSCRRDSQKEKRLSDAAKEGDLDTVRELIKTTFVDTTEGSSYGSTTFMQAADRGHKDIVQILLENGANIDHQNNKGATALMLAAQNGHRDIVQILLDNNANIDQQYDNGVTALISAAFNGHKDIVQILLDNGANINHQEKYGQTALWSAAFNGHKDIVQILLDNGANINHQDKNGWTALILAADNGHTDIVRLLLDNNAKIDLQDAYGQTALLHSASKGFKNVVQLLLARGANRRLKVHCCGIYIGRTACDWNRNVDYIIPSCN